MSFTDEDNRNNYPGNGTAGPFAFEGRLTDEVDLLVAIRDTTDVDDLGLILTLTTHYTVTGVGSNAGVQATLLAPYDALSSDWKISLLSKLEVIQPAGYRNEDEWSGADHEESFDRNARLALQQQDQIDRSWKYAETFDGEDTSIPAPITGAFLQKIAAGWQWVKALAQGAIVTPVSTIVGNIMVWNSTTGDDFADSGLSYKDVARPLSTGLIKGCAITINGGTTVDIALGSGLVADSYTDPDDPTEITQPFSGVTALVMDNIATSPVSFLGIKDGIDTVVQQVIPFTDEERRDYWWLGFAVHIDNVNISTVGTGVNTVTDVNNSIRDLTTAIGLVTNGSVYSGNGANLKLDRTAGTKHFNDINFYNNAKDPNKLPMASATQLSFVEMYQDTPSGFVITAPTTDVDVAQYDDDSGTLQSVSTNQWTLKRIYFFADGSTTVTYGQDTYNSSDQALAAIGIENPVINPLLPDSSHRMYLVVRGGGSDLTNSADAIFRTTTRFGNLGGVSGGATGGANGDMIGPASSTDEEIARQNGTSGKSIQSYTATPPTIDDNGIVNVNNATDATTLTDGSLQTDGGLSVVKDAVIGGDANVQGQVDISSASAGQIKFPATQNPSADVNTLDDYEKKGTWTIGIQDDSRSDGEGQTYLIRVGFFTKIGNEVTIKGFVSATSLGTLTAGQDVVLSGLPFTSESTANSNSSVAFSNGGGLSLTAGTTVTGQIDPSTTVIRLKAWDLTTGSGDMIVSELTSTATFIFTATYFV